MRRKIAFLASAAVILLVLAGAGVVAWLAWTETGLARLVGALQALDTPRITIEGAQGRLAGPLRIRRFELQTDRLGVRAEDIELEQDLLAIAIGRIAIGRLRAGAAEVSIGPRTTPPEEGPPSFMPRWLSLAIDSAEIGRLRVVLPNDAALDFRDIRLSGTVTHNRIEVDELAVDAGAWTARGTAGLVARDPLRLRGDVEWTARGEPALAGSLRAEGDLDSLEISANLTAPVAATADAMLTNLDEELRWEASVESASLDLAAWLQEPPVGPLGGYLRGRGSLRECEVEGHLDGPGLTADGLDLAVKLARDAGILDIAALRLATPDGRLSIESSGRVRLTGERSLELHTAWSGLSWPLAGPVTISSRQGSLDVQGWSELDFSLDAKVLPQQAPELALAATGRADATGVTVQKSTVQSAAGAAQAAGFFGFDPIRPWKLEARVSGLDLSAVKAGLESDLSFLLSGSGTGIGPGSTWAAQVGSIAGNLRGHAASGAGFVVHSPGRYEFNRFDFTLGPARLEINGHYGDDTALVAEVDAPDLSGLYPGLGGSVEATLDVRSAGTPLPDRPNLRVDLALRGRDLRYGEQKAAVLSADADLDLSDRESSWIRLRAAGIEAGGQPVEYLRVALDGLARDHTVDFQLGTGDRAVSLTGQGSLRDLVYRLAADRIESDAPRLHPYALEAPMRLMVAADAARLEEACFVHPPRRVCVEGEWSQGSGWSAGLAVASFPLEALRVDLPRRPGYTGRLDLDLRAEGKPEQPWTASGNGTIREARLYYATPSGRREELDLGLTGIQFQSLPDGHRLSVVTTDSDALQFYLEASLGREAGVPMKDSPLQGDIRLQTTRLGLLPLLVPEIDYATGTLRANLSLSGSPSALVTGGTVTLEGGELDFYQTNLRLRAVEARISLLETGLRLSSTGAVGSGTFNAAGSLAWTGGVLRGELGLKGERLLVADVPEARIEASPDLKFAIDGQDISVSGSVTVPTARIEPRQLVGAVLPATDVRVVEEGQPEDSGAPYRIRTDVRMNLGKDVRIDAFGLRGRLEGSVLTQTRPGEVATASGELGIEDGKYSAYSKELEVERGRLLFAGGPVSEPGVDLRASKKVPGYEVGVVARGRLRKPELSLYSVPPMPQSQIASLLLVGRRLDHLESGDRKAIGGSSSDMAAEGGALLAGQLGRYIGIDEVSLETDSDEESSLVIGKFLSPRFYISYGISLTEAINTFKLRYTVGDRWVVSVEAGEESSADIEYTIDR